MTIVNIMADDLHVPVMCVLLNNISMVSGTNHSSLDRHFFQNDDKNDKTHRAQNVYLSRPT